MRSATGIVVLTMVLHPHVPLQAGVVPGRWEKVQTLEPATRVVLTLRTKDTFAGEFLGINDRTIRLEVQGQERDYAKAAILEMRALTAGWSRPKRAGVAALVAFPIGFLVGYAIAESVADDDLSGGQRVGAGMGVGALVAAIAGGLSATGRSRDREVVIYRAPP